MLNQSQDLYKGHRIQVRAYRSSPNCGLTYPAFTATLLEDAGNSEGWDVVDVLNEKQEVVSIYCFSILRQTNTTMIKTG